MRIGYRNRYFRVVRTPTATTTVQCLLYSVINKNKTTLDHHHRQTWLIASCRRDVICLLLCPVCLPGETQRCMKCSGQNEEHCDSTGLTVNCEENVSSTSCDNCMDHRVHNRAYHTIILLISVRPSLSGTNRRRDENGKGTVGCGSGWVSG